VSAAREAFLERVRKAVAEGNRAGEAQAVLPRCTAGYQGAGDDPVACFVSACQAAGAQAHVVSSTEEAVHKVQELVQSTGGRRVVLGRGEVINRLDLEQALRGQVSVVWREPLPMPDAAPDVKAAKEQLFAADLGITGVDWLIAETGSIVLCSRPGQARSLSLLPPVHIAVAERGQILPDLFDLFTPGRVDSQPANVTLITGPSKTGDIELKLVTGVHGPGEVHVVIVV
jgi:L-lactate utilization protein LutC